MRVEDTVLPRSEQHCSRPCLFRGAIILTIMAGQQHFSTAFFLFCLLCASITLSQAEEDNINVTILETSPTVSSKGSSFTLSCKLNAGLQIILSHTIGWLKESREPVLTNDSVVISRQQTILLDYPQAERFKVDFESARGSVIVTLMVENVEEADDGRYVCQLKTLQSSKVTSKDTIDVIVPSKVERMMLTIDDRDVNGSAKVTPGSHSLQCVAEGINPNTTMLALKSADLQLDSPNVTTSLMRQASISAGAPRYRQVVESMTNISSSDQSKTVACLLRSQRAIFISTLHVVPQPKVSCDDVKVHRDDPHVQLACTVTHSDLMVEDYMWELADSGIIYSTEGPAYNNTVVTEKLTDSETRVSLRLDVVKWGDTRTLFKLTAVTEVGDVSADAYIIVVSDGDDDKDSGDEDDHDDDDDDHDDDDDDHDDDDDDHDDDDDDHGHGHGHGQGSNGSPGSLSKSKLLVLLLLAMGFFNNP